MRNAAADLPFTIPDVAAFEAPTLYAKPMLMGVFRGEFPPPLGGGGKVVILPPTDNLSVRAGTAAAEETWIA